MSEGKGVEGRGESVLPLTHGGPASWWPRFDPDGGVGGLFRGERSGAAFCLWAEALDVVQEGAMHDRASDVRANAWQAGQACDEVEAASAASARQVPGYGGKRAGCAWCREGDAN